MTTIDAASDDPLVLIEEGDEQEHNQEHRPLKKRRLSLSPSNDMTQMATTCTVDGKREKESKGIKHVAAHVSDDEDERREEMLPSSPGREDEAAHSGVFYNGVEAASLSPSCVPSLSLHPLLAFEAGRPVKTDAETFTVASASESRLQPMPPRPALPPSSVAATRLSPLSWLTGDKNQEVPIEYHRSPTPSDSASSSSLSSSSPPAWPFPVAGEYRYPNDGGKTRRLIAYLTKKRRRIVVAAQPPPPPLLAPAPRVAMVVASPKTPVPPSPKLPVASAAAAYLPVLAPTSKAAISSSSSFPNQSQRRSGLVAAAPQPLRTKPVLSPRMAPVPSHAVIPLIYHQITPQTSSHQRPIPNAPMRPPASHSAVSVHISVGQADRADILEAALALASFAPQSTEAAIAK
uniref:Uncharacterized protein n=1 Tax=Odontella aurita TaxID=265563 RepID=A0A7S4I4P4_9STRA|mmetsp:Transcript_19744/g.57315  ORF Transcript_19744/g.57315 Transcript_19744/m.57315 type:complete len:404 (+) Transcript_19744:694-1905(+)|eukprot:CAMPEP_0113559774 /NCGR_PEP_ID=MMETSP0015_2-20120614/19076_1 /TAXON_ID=2838 /ORGANISM="Odontella" /LENGTH=403 /DNA_ID=CAMNT_0000461433 /DNA_START=619 /DNA_END=1830 /DNA_ORIENTATION=- /assembly_acc=CAM_ASM_000160